jgi:hypothetical protein
MELDDMEEERAGRLIMSARAHWFDESETADTAAD